MKLYFEENVTELKNIIRLNCNCKSCNGNDENCQLYRPATQKQVKMLSRTLKDIDSMSILSKEDKEEMKNDEIMKLVAATAKINMPHPRNSNRVYRNPLDCFPLRSDEIAYIAKGNTTAKDFEKGGRLEGNLCGCNGNGEFVICPDNKPNDKVYIQCRKCGGYSHL